MRLAAVVRVYIPFVVVSRKGETWCICKSLGRTLFSLRPRLGLRQSISFVFLSLRHVVLRLNLLRFEYVIKANCFKNPFKICSVLFSQTGEVISVLTVHLYEV